MTAVPDPAPGGVVGAEGLVEAAALVLRQKWNLWPADARRMAADLHRAGLLTSPAAALPAPVGEGDGIARCPECESDAARQCTGCGTIRDDVRIATGAVRVGICGDRTPLILPAGGDEEVLICDLPSGHLGWHSTGRGQDWTHGEAKP